MKRDLDLFRIILLDVEAMPAGQPLTGIKHSDYSKEIINEHVHLLSEADLIEVIPIKAGSTRSIRKYQINRLTNLGHDFIAYSNNPDSWIMAKEHFVKSGVSVSLELIIEYLKLKSKEKTGIP